MLNKLFKVVGLFVIVSLTIFITWAYVPEPKTVPLIESNSETQYWHLNRGFKIAYSHFGNTDKTVPPIIFLHGGPGGYIHSAVIETLKPLSQQGFELYFYDQLGSGRSERPAKFSDVTLGSHVSDLHEIVTQHIGTNKVTLVAHSFGADIAAHFVARYPDLVHKIVFSSPGGITPEPYDNDGNPIRYHIPTPKEYNFVEPWSYHETSDNAILKPKPMLALAGALLFDIKLISDNEMDTLFNNLVSKVTAGMVCDPINVKPEEGGAGAYAYMSTNYNPDAIDIRPSLKPIPSITLHGQCDSIPYGVAIEFSELFGADYHFIENAGHIIWWEQPDTYYELILAFLKSP
ncbi:alpha/beta fold hydrolase [Alteromonas facilis]|uniref:alpha/beta fold hydrolase n=1 Tax=Alteromonas facilis TaxID=2048004 RepID=UPI000C283556|nr:alpha/beta hydrolase [Alteromonas facilis]